MDYINFLIIVINFISMNKHSHRLLVIFQLTKIKIKIDNHLNDCQNELIICISHVHDSKVRLFT